ncbi:hypothetical protein PMAYCL1PPCAC_22135, partial [Pristionchus mayeri]
IMGDVMGDKSDELPAVAWAIIGNLAALVLAAVWKLVVVSCADYNCVSMMKKRGPNKYLPNNNCTTAKHMRLCIHCSANNKSTTGMCALGWVVCSTFVVACKYIF